MTKTDSKTKARASRSAAPPCSAFHRWWKDEGIAETIDIEDDALVRRIRSLCKIAWSNGEYKSCEYEQQNNATGERRYSVS